MPSYRSIELNEILHAMCKDIYCQLQHMITELLDCKQDSFSVTFDGSFTLNTNTYNVH